MSNYMTPYYKHPDRDAIGINIAQRGMTGTDLMLHAIYDNIMRDMESRGASIASSLAFELAAGIMIQEIIDHDPS